MKNESIMNVNQGKSTPYLMGLLFKKDYFKALASGLGVIFFNLA